MRIAVLGATGMIGAHVANEAVRRGHEVIAISRRGLAAPGTKPFETRAADILDVGGLRNALHGAEAVIHCAAYYPTRFRRCAEEVQLAEQQAKAFYAACADLPLQRIVFVGAAVAIPRERDGSPSNGQKSYPDRPSDQNSYLQVKWLQDFLARHAAKQGLPVVIGVPAMTFGEYDPGNSTGRFILGVAHGQMKGFVNGNRNVVYAGDAARGLVLAAENGKIGRRYLFTGQNRTMAQIMEHIAVLVAKPIPRESSLQMIRALQAWQVFRFRFLKGPEPTISDTAIAVMASGQFLDGAVAERDLGYKASISGDEAIERAIAWFRSTSKLAPGLTIVKLKRRRALQAQALPNKFKTTLQKSSEEYGNRGLVRDKANNSFQP